VHVHDELAGQLLRALVRRVRLAASARDTPKIGP
jgi:hypothetical protein